MLRLRWLLSLTALVVAGALGASAPAWARHGRGHIRAHVRRHLPRPGVRALRRASRVPVERVRGHARAAAEDEGAGEENEALRAAEDYSAIRTAPGSSVSARAVSTARRAAAALPQAGAWSELTTQPYDSDAPLYRDPVWSNSGGGAGLVAGRITALASRGGVTYAGAADGGVWKSTDAGGHWTPVLDSYASISVGALAIDPADGSVWVGLGEANTNSDSYLGQGVLRSGDGGATWRRVGGGALTNALVGRLTFDGRGHVYAATSRGLYRRSSTDTAAPWTPVLRPGVGPYGTTFVNDVQVQPGTGGAAVIANVGWRAGTSYNGFYRSTQGGAAGTWHRVAVRGALAQPDIGRSTFAYSANGRLLYAVVQSPRLLADPDPDQGNTVLAGVFVSRGGVAGPWKLIADEPKLLASGSGLEGQVGYGPGIQAWYNQFLQVDPNDSRHVYLGLEEVYETRNAGETWDTIGPYWNFPFSCFARDPDSCPKTTHPDQHAVALSGPTLFVGNDGGVYSRRVRRADRWNDLNATLHTLQYYFADSGPVAGGEAWWGGLQDNGESLLGPGASTMVSPFGGDGGDTLVDKHNGHKAVVEYTDLDMSLTRNGGVSDGSQPSFREFSPSCEALAYTPNPCDPNARFTAPFEADQANPSHWVAGGQYVWNDRAAFASHCSDTSCSWKKARDTGEGHTVTALGVNKVTYAAWCGPAPGCNPDDPDAPEGGFVSGIDTNHGGSWHRLHAPNLPNRYIAALTVDPADPAHVYAVYNGFSRRWIEGGGTGHVFESRNGGATWTDISGDLPDIGGDDLVISHGTLVLATDVGVFEAPAASPGHWTRFGPNLPSASVNDLALSSDGATLVAATHGRGLWQTPAP